MNEPKHHTLLKFTISFVCVCYCFIVLYQHWDLCCTFSDKCPGETYQKTWNTPQIAGETGMLAHSPITCNFSPDYCSDDLVIPCAQLMYSDGTLKSDILDFQIYSEFEAFGIVPCPE